jgi:hypothetical protein
MGKAYKCNKCNEYKDGSPYAILNLHVNITKRNMSSFTLFNYSLCSDCFSEIRKEFGNPYSEKISSDIKGAFDLGEEN